MDKYTRKHSTVTKGTTNMENGQIGKGRINSKHSTVTKGITNMENGQIGKGRIHMYKMYIERKEGK